MPAEVVKSVEEVKESENETPKAPSAKPMVGIIYPPPEVRNIVDKTAGFVARNGPEFEGRIRQNEVSNAKFNFLNPGDPYHAYYRHKVKEFVEGKANETAATTVPKVAPPKPVAQVIETIVPKEAPATFEFTADPPSINTFELDIVKLTAQFVARNGRQFLTNLMNKESRNYLFDFLRPQHSMFNYFTKLVEQYTKILIPPKDLQKKLRACDSMKAVLDEVRYRVEWEKLQEKQRRKEEEARERERVAYAQIDWHNFVVVETVDYQPNEQGQFPPPIQQDEVGNRVIAEERFEQFGETLAEDEDVEMEVEEEESSESESDESEEDEDEDGEKEGKEIKEKKKKKKKVVERKEESEEEEEEEEEEEDEEEKDVATRDKLAEDAATPPLKTTDDQNTEVQDMDEGDSDMEESDEEEEADEESKVKDEEKSAPGSKDSLPMPPPLPPQPGEVQIRKDYDPKAPKPAVSTAADDKFLVSPITGMKIPADKMEEHMRIGLLDQRWMEQRSQNIERAKEEEVFAAGGSIAENIKKLAERRTDIFGEGDVETQIGKKIGEEEDPSAKQKVIWDGHSASMESTTRKAQANITIEEQIEALHKAQGLLPDEEKERIGPKKVQEQKGEAPKPPRPPPPKPKAPAPMTRPPMQRNMPPLPPPPTPVNVVMPPGMPVIRAQPVVAMQAQPPMMAQQSILVRPMMGGPSPMDMPRPPPVIPPQQMIPPPPPFPGGGGPVGPGPDGEPPAKRQKTEDSLIPEQQFLSMHRGPVSFRIQIPAQSDKPEWKLNGQMMNIMLPLTDQVSVIKAKIFEELGMPTGKQKLQYEGMFIKDSNTLAFYNFMNGSVVQLQVKERGGRKR
ncbi:Splicing factor 3A subunit 1 [Holothuria leucospilota]|uniref:Splicing factor 3A subunit 1 n=1 Tax=Holothuria leucospilota TaxID=206669 RepID=A0A9Q1CNW4_HOLLE|nr:Splicing factor 3A subunit 1 [Holothuria leucospilota]